MQAGLFVKKKRELRRERRPSFVQMKIVLHKKVGQYAVGSSLEKPSMDRVPIQPGALRSVRILSPPFVRNAAELLKVWSKPTSFFYVRA